MTFDPQELSENADYLQRLAQHLIPDHHAAEDAAQRVAAAYLGKRSETPEKPRAWMAGALRKERLKWLARARRRTELEAHPDQIRDPRSSEADVSSSELVDRIAQEVRALREPYRGVLWASLFEEQSLAEIALELGRPDATVRSQHMRGLELLRRRLDGKLGGRGAWVAILLPLNDGSDADGVGGVEATTARSLGSASGWLFVAATVAGLLLWAVSGERDLRPDAPSSPAPVRDASLPKAERPSTANADAERSAGGARFPLVAASDVDAVATETPRDARRLRIRAVDETGAPVGGASVVRAPIPLHTDPFTVPSESPQPEFAETDERGEAEFELSLEDMDPDWKGPPQVSLQLRREGYLCPAEYRLTWNPELAPDAEIGPFEMVLWRAPLEVEFQALDEAGEALRDVSITLEVKTTFENASLPQDVDSGFNEILLKPDGDGSPPTALLAPGRYKLVVHAPERGVTVQMVQIDSSGTHTVRFGPRRVVRGRVLDGASRPLPGAHVWFERDAGNSQIPWSWRSTTADQDGFYELLLGDVASVELYAFAESAPTGPAYRSLLVSSDVTEDFDLQIGTDAFRRVRVVDGAGSPLVNWCVRVFIQTDTSQDMLLSTTNDQGIATFLRPREGRIDLGVYGPGEGRIPALLHIRGFDAQPEETLLVVEQAHAEPSTVLGLLDTPGWTPEHPFALAVSEPSSPFAQLHPLSPAGEPFALEDLPPGPVLLTALSDGSLAWDLGQFLLPSGSFVDVGEVVIPPPGKVQFVAEPAGSLESAIALALVVPTFPRPFPPTVIDLAGWPAGSFELLPGTYRVTLIDSASSALRAEFEVRSGETTTVTLGR